jgi:hypothetical protein
MIIRFRSWILDCVQRFGHSELNTLTSSFTLTYRGSPISPILTLLAVKP